MTLNLPVKFGSQYFILILPTISDGTTARVDIISYRRLGRPRSRGGARKTALVRPIRSVQTDVLGIDRRESATLAGIVSQSHSPNASGEGLSHARITGATGVPFPRSTNVDSIAEAQASFTANAGAAASVFPGSARRLCHMAVGSAGRKAVAAAYHHFLRL